MASSTTIMVPTTASRFALLQIDSDSDSDNSEAGKIPNKGGSGKQRPEKSVGGKASQSNDKKKDKKKKKKKEQQQSEANELRNLAFKKIPQKSHGPPTLSGIAGELLSSPSVHGATPSSQQGWQQWKQRDEQMTSEMYEADLEKALILSKLEYEQNKQQGGSSSNHASSPKSRKDGGSGGGSKEKKKRNAQAKDKKTVSLQDFQAEGSAEHVNRRQEKEEAANSALGLGQEERFFNKLEDDVSQIIQREKKRKQYNGRHEGDAPAEHEPDPRAEQLKYDLEKKDQEIRDLKKTIAQWEVKYKEVKARNGQLLKMLQQGEMKDKAEILLQVEELLHIKEELSTQVTLLHAALEQERSKVKCLQSEQPKHQGNKRGKKSSEADL